MPRKPGIPKYCQHKASGQALVRIDGRDRYLGTYGSDESRTIYDRLIVEWLARGRRSGVAEIEKPLITINEVIVAFWDHAEKHYRKPDGTPTSEIDTYRQLIRPLSALYGETPATQFGPLKLKAVRQRMIEMGWSRNHINKQCSRVKTIFRWAAEEEMVGGDLFHALRAVKGLQRGRTEAPESEPVRPVPDHMITAIIGALRERRCPQRPSLGDWVRWLATGEWADAVSVPYLLTTGVLGRFAALKDIETRILFASM